MKTLWTLALLCLPGFITFAQPCRPVREISPYDDSYTLAAWEGDLKMYRSEKDSSLLLVVHALSPALTHNAVGDSAWFFLENGAVIGLQNVANANASATRETALWATTTFHTIRFMAQMNWTDGRQLANQSVSRIKYRFTSPPLSATLLETFKRNSPAGKTTKFSQHNGQLHIDMTRVVPWQQKRIKRVAHCITQPVGPTE